LLSDEIFKWASRQADTADIFHCWDLRLWWRWRCWSSGLCLLCNCR
jgi:hypothetical protein